ncbi:ribonuclease H-like domain-containing protein [Tanacetum coccineum]
MCLSLCQDTSSNNEGNTGNGVSTVLGHNSQGQASSSSYTDDLIGHFERDVESLRNQGNRNGDERYRSRDNTKRTVPVETSDALVVRQCFDGPRWTGYDWSYKTQDNQLTEKPRIIAQNPKVDRRDWNGKMTQKLRIGFGFTKKSCFVCGIYNHLIKDCDFHEKRMAKKSVLKNMEKNTSQREIRPVWNSAQRINHQNKFVPSAVLTRLERVPVSAAKQSSPRATTSTSTFRPVNTATRTNRVNVSELRTHSFYKSHSPIRRANPQPALKNKGIILTVDVQHITGTKTSLMTIKTLMEVSLPLVRSEELEMNEFCGLKGIKREFSVAKIPQQNGVAERKNKTLIEAARTMLADSLLPTVFWAENLSGKTTRASSTNSFNTVSTPVNAAGAPRTSNDAGPSFVPLGGSFLDDPLMPDLEDTAEADFNNKEPSLLIEAIKLFLAYASFMNFLVYQMDVKSAFLYGTIEEEVMLANLQDKYVGEILKKFGFSSIRTASTPMETNKALTKDEDGVDVDIHLYNSMIGSLMYLTSSIPDIIVSSDSNFLSTMVQSTMLSPAVVISESSVRSDLLFNDEDGLKDLPEPFNDTYVTPCHTKKVFSNMARKSVNFSGNITPLFASMLVQNQAPEGEGSAIHPEPQPTPSTSQPNVLEPQIASLHIETSPTAAPQTEAHQTAVSQIVFHEAHIEQIPPSPTTYQRKRKTQKCRRTKKDTELPQTSVPLDHGADEAVHKEGVTVWQSQAPRNHGGTPAQTRSERVLEQPNEPPLSEGHTSGSGEGRMEQTFELTDNVPSTPHDSPLTGGYTPGSDEGRMKLDELITLCTKLSKQVLDLEKEKDAQAVEILNLKKRVKKLERKRKSSISHPRRRKYRQVETSSDDGLDEEDASKQGRRSDKIKPMFTDKDFEELDDHMENVEEETVDAEQTELSTMKEQKAKEKGVAITDVEDSSRTVRPVRSITTLQPLLTIDPKDKGKGVLVEEERKRRNKERIAQEEASMAALYEEYDTIQAIIDADALFAAKLQQEERELYEKEKRWIDDFQPMDTEAIKDSEKKVDSSSKPAGGSRKKTLARKRAGEKKSEESAKKQKLEDVAEEQESAKSDEEAAADYEHEKEELRMWLTVVSDEEETVDPKILSAKYPIVDWESQNLGNVDMEDLHVYKIIRADGNTSYHKSLSSMLRKFDRQDLVDLHRLVMKRFEDTTPEGYNLLLWGDLKVMFEPNAEDEIWSNQQDWTLISWKLYESCGVHTLLMDGTLTSFNMLVEKRYPLIKEMLQKMLNWKLEAEAESTMAFELLKFIKFRIRGGQTSCLKLAEDPVPSTYEVGQSFKSTLNQRIADETPTPRIPVRNTWEDPKDDSPVIPSLVASLVPTASVDEDDLLEIGAQLELYRSILHDHTKRLDALPPTLFKDMVRTSLSYFLGQEQSERRFILSISGIGAWNKGKSGLRLLLARYKDHREIHDLRMQRAADRRDLQELRDRVIALE